MPQDRSSLGTSCDAAPAPLRLKGALPSGERGTPKRKPRRARYAPIAAAGAARRPLLVPAAALLFGAFLAWRSLSPPEESGIAGRAGLAAALLVGMGGLLALASSSFGAALSSLLSRPRRALGALVAAATALLAAADLLAGRSALVAPCGAVILGLLHWDRPAYLLALLGADLLAALAAIAAPLFAASPAPASIGALAGDPFVREQLALLAAAACLGAAVASALGSAAAPGNEKLRSLELENRELRDLSFRDGLTGLYNRRFAQEAGRKLFARAARYGESFHALMIDIDRFKQVNDRLSHAAGDEVLKEVALILQGCVRSSDVVARYGGEEFVVFLVEASSETAQFIANRIRDDVAAHRFGRVPWQVTISVGIASMLEGESLSELVDRADKSLYAAKRSGRNRVSGF